MGVVARGVSGARETNADLRRAVVSKSRPDSDTVGVKPTNAPASRVMLNVGPVALATLVSRGHVTLVSRGHAIDSATDHPGRSTRSTRSSVTYRVSPMHEPNIYK